MIPVGIPSETRSPAIHIVPVVPMLAPRTAPIAAGKGNAPPATRPMIAVVDRAVEVAYEGKKNISWMEVYCGEKSRRFMVKIFGYLMKPLRH